MEPKKKNLSKNIEKIEKKQAREDLAKAISENDATINKKQTMIRVQTMISRTNEMLIKVKKDPNARHDYDIPNTDLSEWGNIVLDTQIEKWENKLEFLKKTGDFDADDTSYKNSKDLKLMEELNKEIDVLLDSLEDTTEMSYQSWKDKIEAYENEKLSIDEKLKRIDEKIEKVDVITLINVREDELEEGNSISMGALK